MTASGRHFARVVVLVGAATLSWAVLAFAQPTTVSSTINGTVATPGRLSRTIIDSDPNGKTQVTNYPVGYTTTLGQTAAQVALGYRDSLNVYLGGAGYKAYFSPGYTNNIVRLTKTTNVGFNTTPENNTSAGIGFTPRTLTVEDAPIASPWLLTSLIPGFATLAWWARRRRRIA